MPGNYVWQIFKKFKIYGTVNNLPNYRKSKIFEDTELKEKAKNHILATASLRNSTRELGLSLYTTFLIQKSFTNLHPYKLKVRKELRAEDKALRVNFRKWFLNSSGRLFDPTLFFIFGQAQLLS